MTETLRHTPLFEEHKAAKGRMVPFAGYEMPVQYSGLIDEHNTVRNAVGLFDVSHMGEFLIEGPKAQEFLYGLTTNDITKLYDGRCQYNLMCYENGTVVDDVIISQLAEDRFLMVVNAANIEKDWQWIQKHLPSEGVQLTNVSENFALIAVQGPKSEELLEKLYHQSFADLKYYHFQVLGESSGDFLKSGNFHEKNVFISRTGYTGEDGFEVLMPNDQAAPTWNALLEAGQALDVKPCGLGARDTLRMEVAYSLYGHEISDEITALEAGLGWVVKLKKDDFIGKSALQKEKEAGPSRKLVGLELLEAGVMRDGYELYNNDGQNLGFITSGTHSPLLKKTIAIALVKAEFSELGTEFQVHIRGKNKNVRVIEKPFYKKDS